jgi:hypothetical protein
MISTDNVIPFNRPDPEPTGFAQVSKAWLWRWTTDRRLTDGEERICVCIYLHFNSDHFKETGDLLAWPSWQSLMDATGLSRRSVSRCLQNLKRLGAFEIKRGPYDHKEKKRGNNRYIARTSKVPLVTPRRGEQGAISAQSKVPPVVTRSGDNRSGESRSKKEQDSKFWNSRGPTAPGSKQESQAERWEREGKSPFTGIPKWRSNGSGATAVSS